MTRQTMTTLPPAGSSASAARRLVEAAIGASELSVLLDEALLLVTELVTNAIVHAGTEVDVHIEVDDDRLRVEVVDRTPGRLHVVQQSPAETREGGRGLYLLDALASEWGTRHFGSGKSVWFLLLGDGAGVGPGGAPGAAGGRAGVRAGRRVSAETSVRPRRDVGWLLGLPPDVEQQLTPAQLIAELLHRLCDGIGVPRCWVYAHAADDERRWEVVATNDPTTAAPTAETVRRAAQNKTDELARDAVLLLPLQSASGTFGAVALEGGADLDPESDALVRLVAERVGVILRDDRARVTQLRSRGSLALLAEASEMFAGTLDVQLAMTLATQLVVPRFARWAAIWATDERVPRLMAIAHADEERLETLRPALCGPDGEMLAMRLARDLGERRPNLLPGSELPTELGEERSGEVLALPLIARRRLVGLLLVGRPAGGIFGADDVSLLNDLGRRTAVAVDSARLYEESTAIAQALQASLLPPMLPVTTVSEFGARYAAAGEGNEVGGDFYDVFELPDGSLGVAIGDVCGKGAAAAAITGMARNILRLLVRDGASPPAALRRLNDAILDLGERGRFCTALLGVIRPDDDRLRLTFSSAGHPAPVLLRADGSVSFVGPSGTLLGILTEVELAEDTVVLEPGDALVFYTDGVTERRSGNKMFGEHNLLACLRSAAGASADAIAGMLEQHVQRFGVARDDLAVLVVRCTGRAAPAAEPTSALSVAAF